MGYNVQTAVETAHHLIVAHDVINEGNDRSQLSPMSKKAKEALGVDKVEVLADSGSAETAQALGFVKRDDTEGPVPFAGPESPHRAMLAEADNWWRYGKRMKYGAPKKVEELLN